MKITGVDMHADTPETLWTPGQTMPPGSTKTTDQDITISTPKHKPTKPRRLTGKQKAFIKAFIDNPTTPLYAIAEQAGYTGNSKTLTETARENLEKPVILAELAKYSDKAEITVVEVMEQSRKQMYNTDKARAVDWANTARQSANDILDRVHGKATQRTEVTKRSVTLNVDLTGVTSADE